MKNNTLQLRFKSGRAPNFERRSRLVPTTPFLYLMVLSVAMGTPLASELIFLSPL